MEDKKIINEVVLKGEALKSVFDQIMELPTKWGSPLVSILLANAVYEEPAAEEPSPKAPSKQGNRK